MIIDPREVCKHSEFLKMEMYEKSESCPQRDRPFEIIPAGESRDFPSKIMRYREYDPPENQKPVDIAHFIEEKVFELLLEDEELKNEVDAKGGALTAQLIKDIKEALPKELILYCPGRAKVKTTEYGKLGGTAVVEGQLPIDENNQAVALLVKPEDNVCFYYKATRSGRYRIYAAFQRAEEAVKIINIATTEAD